jgi:hypothetical protein
VSKKKILGVTSAVVGLLLTAVVLYAYYDFTHNFRFPLTSDQISEAEIAFKGALGEVMFSGRQAEVIPNSQMDGKTGLAALLTPRPDANRGDGLIKAYQKDPKKFRRYAEMFDTVLNAKQVGDALMQRRASDLPRTTEPLQTPANIKADAWGNPFCIFSIGLRIAVVSGGPSHLSCKALPLTTEQIAASHRTVFGGPSDVVVVIVERHNGTPALPAQKAPIS